MHPSAWKTVAAAAAGPDKGERGCQDAVGLRVVRHKGQSALVVVLADGAGSARWGGDAARLAVKTALEFAVTRLTRRMAGKARKVHWRVADTALALERARRAVTRAAAAAGDALGDWGTTALVAVLTEEAAVLGQIGDGAICLCHKGAWSCPLWPDLDGYVNVTAFLTHPKAPMQACVAAPADAVILVSDGLQALALDYKNRVPHQPFCEGVVRELQRSADSRKLQRDLQRWLGSAAVRARTDDDTSLAMAVRPEVAAP